MLCVRRCPRVQNAAIAFEHSPLGVFGPEDHACAVEAAIRAWRSGAQIIFNTCIGSANQGFAVRRIIQNCAALSPDCGRKPLLWETIMYAWSNGK